MTTCELCGRAYAQKAITPFWFPHQNVCDRVNCRQSVRDAVEAVIGARERFNPLIREIAKRHEKPCHAPIGYRQDTMCEIDVIEERDWWANKVVKRKVE